MKGKKEKLIGLPTREEEPTTTGTESNISLISVPQGRFMGEIVQMIPERMVINEVFVLLQEGSKIGLSPTPAANMAIEFPTNVVHYRLKGDHPWIDMYNRACIQHYSGITIAQPGDIPPAPPGGRHGQN